MQISPEDFFEEAEIQPLGMAIRVATRQGAFCINSSSQVSDENKPLNDEGLANALKIFLQSEGKWFK